MKYDPFQQKAIDYINQNFSVIVSAPTGAGKTAIAEHVINDCLEKSKKAVYTAPIKALSNQKFRDFQGIFHDKIGILTGDVSINATASILIMTTEIFRNKIISEISSLDEYSWIIFDEIHYLDNYERGTVWEESLIFLPSHMKMLALSATIPNINEFAEWIHSIHNCPLKIVKEEKRPVPLHFFYQYQGEIFDNIHKIHNLRTDKPQGRHPRARKFYESKNTKPNRLGSLIRHLSEHDRLPCLYFAFGRRRCETLAEEMRGFDFLSFEEKQKIRGLYSDLCNRFDLEGEKSTAIMRPLIERGIAYHHAGMLPTLKEVVERLFTSRLIKIIFTTETFALGINMPSRTVIFDELRKYYGRGFATLKTRDFYQMAGRAGRRGIDSEGFVYSRVNANQISSSELQRVIFSPPEKVRSRFNLSYATILNLYDKYQDSLYDIYPRSFHFFQDKKNKQGAVEIMRTKVRLLKELEYIKDSRLTEKGYFAGNVYGYELSLSELYEQGTLEHLSEIDLGVLITALVFDPRKGAERPKVNKHIKYLRQMTDSVIYGIHKREKKHGIQDLSKDYYYHLSPCVEAWMRQEPFEKILKFTDADEGEVIRNFRMCLQILREILDSPAPPSFKDKVKKAVYLINRDIVDAEKQLREI
ncbi:MAG: DEAD/DEAH box helicase [Candidatus Omnitrophota bacterium]